MEAIRKLTNEELLKLSNEESKKITRESIITAVILLCAEKPFEKITVTEIVKKAGVSRTAFYRNYETKEDVIRELGGKVIKKLNSFFSGEIYDYNGKALLIDLLNCIKNNSGTVSILLSSDRIVFSILCGETYLDRFLTQETATNRYATVAIEIMIKKTIIEWFKTGMKESVEFVADYCSKTAKAIWNLENIKS